jgi:hypothetical protein
VVLASSQRSTGRSPAWRSDSVMLSMWGRIAGPVAGLVSAAGGAASDRSEDEAEFVATSSARSAVRAYATVCGRLAGPY